MIRFDAVSKTYPGGTVAVEDFSLRIPERTTTVFLGTSGCGKTTLMRMVNAMVAPTSGRVLVRGQDVAEQDPVALRRSIGYVLQEGGLFPHRTIADNIATVPLLEGAPRRQARARALELMDLVGLDRDMAGRYPAQLSGGQRQRVGVARALANEADILLMDEPFGALDPLVRADLQAELIRIREQLGTTILFVTHDIDEVVCGVGEQLQAGPHRPPARGPGGRRGGDPRGHPARTRPGGAPMTWLMSNWGLVGELALTHLAIAVPAIVCSVLVAVPVGWCTARSKRVGPPVLAVLSAMYAVPSLPLLIIVPVVVGVSYRSPVNMVLILTLYGVAVLVRQSAEGFSAIERATLRSATACGFGTVRRFWQVELPLATPVIVAGTRVVVTSTVSLVTIGAFVGVRSLGTLFTDGFQRGLVAEVVVGLAATIALALGIDALVAGIGRAATPWTRAGAAADDEQGARA